MCTVKIRLIQSFGGALRNLAKNRSFALTRHQERNLKIRIHAMKDNINAVILIPKPRRSDYPRDRSNWRKILRLKISKSIYKPKIAWTGPSFSILSDNSYMLFPRDRSKSHFIFSKLPLNTKNFRQ